LVVFFVVFLDDFFAAFFIAMALVTSFQAPMYVWQISQSIIFCRREHFSVSR